ncbi:MAG: hypothetical protein WAW80_04705 [Candidatus Saccharimonadales bacterium]
MSEREKKMPLLAKERNIQNTDETRLALEIPLANADQKIETIDKLDAIHEKYMNEDGHISNPKDAIKEVFDILTTASVNPQEKANFLLNIKNIINNHTVDEASKTALDEIANKQYLPELIDSLAYRDMSREIGRLLRDREDKSVPKGYFGEIDETKIVENNEAPVPSEILEWSDENLPTFSSVSPLVRSAIIERLVDAKLIDKTKTHYKFPKKVRSQKYLLSGSLELADGWRIATERKSEIRTRKDANEAIERHDKKRAISEVIIETNKPGFSVVPINSLRIGHQDFKDGLALVEAYTERLKYLTDEEKPDAILVTDLMQGVYKHSQSNKRTSVIEEFQDAGAQFNLGHNILKDIKESSGIPIIVGMSENDHREAYDYAIDAVRELREYLKDAEGNDFVHFSQMYKYSQESTFKDFQKFALDFVIPLGLKYGRRLRTADEMSTDTDGQMSQSEFMHLYEHVRLRRDLDPRTGIDPDDILTPGEWSADGSIIYVDDCNLIFRQSDGEEKQIKYRHAMGLTTESLLNNHMINPMKFLGSIAMRAESNDELPTAFMTGQQQEAVMATHSGVDVISNPGLTNPSNSIDTRAFYRRSTGDTSLRAYTTRRREWDPGIYEYSRPAKGVVRYTIYDKDVMERSRSIPRMAIVTQNDWQFGSPTAHPDIVLHTQALTQRYAKRMPTAIHGEGDFKHGLIYPNMPREAQAIGLLDLDSQSEMVNGVIRDTWQEAPSTTKEGIIDVMWLPGNHDEAQRVRYPNNHSRNVDDTIDTWRQVLENPDVAQDDSVVRTERVFQSADGTPIPTWIGRPRYGDVSMAIAHYHINSKNYKGGSGGLAVYDPFKRIEGMGGFEKIQIASGAHHHNRMHTKVNGTWIDIGDSIAGQSEFENMLGMHHSNMSLKVREIGAGEPMVITYFTEEALVNTPIEHGPYSKERLADARFFDDEGADPLKYSMYSLDGSPQTAEQKLLWQRNREASQWANHMSEPLIVERGSLNRVTQRLFDTARRLEDQNVS